jgi:hypothetical protein
VMCPRDGYFARVTRMWLTDMGAPLCLCSEQMRVDDSLVRVEVLVARRSSQEAVPPQGQAGVRA